MHFNNVNLSENVKNTFFFFFFLPPPEPHHPPPPTSSPEVHALLLSDVFVFLQEKDQRFVFAMLVRLLDVSLAPL